MAEFVELVLTCGSWQEAQRIADCLLEKKLVACIEFIEVQSRFRWQGKQEEAEEIKLHSYDVPALHAIPIMHISKDAAKWLGQETNE